MSSVALLLGAIMPASTQTAFNWAPLKSSGQFLKVNILTNIHLPRTDSQDMCPGLLIGQGKFNLMVPTT